MELRYYQKEAVEAAYEHLRTKDTNPCIVLPTGTGKSVVIAKIVSDAIKLWNGRVLILAHVKELLEQNAAKIKAFLPDIPVGIYSAGLKSRSTDEPVIVAGIQSVYNKACDLGAFDLVIVDEAHLIPTDGDGMYRKFLKDMKVVNPKVRVVGLTATPFRLKGGLICKPENILNEVCYEAGLKEMIQQGFLAPLISRAGCAEADLDKLHVRGGEFINSEIAEAMDKEDIVNSACKEIVELTKDRKSVLIFTTSVDHCKHVAEKIEEFSNSECAIVTGDTSPVERAEILKRFKAETVVDDFFETPKPPLKFLSNVNVLTTGFDAPNTDCVVLLRPTYSAGLLIQMVGRGTRLSPNTGKTNCLVLDYGKNIIRHGPVDMITVKESKEGRESDGDPPAKMCPNCRTVVAIVCRTCPTCGFNFPMNDSCKLSKSASKSGILSGETSYEEHLINHEFYCVHHKRNNDNFKPNTMRIDYRTSEGLLKSEWVCPGHTGYAREKFEKWWKQRANPNYPIPKSAKEAVEYANNGVLAQTLKIKIKNVAGEKFPRITEYVLGDIPVGDPNTPNWVDEVDDYSAEELDGCEYDLPF